MGGNFEGFRPGSDADLFMSRTYYIELSTWKVRRLNQLGTPISIAVLARLGIPTLERLWNGFDSDPELFMYWT